MCFFNRLRPFLGTGSEGISSKKVLTNETFKAKVGFEAEINIIAKAKVEVDKFSTVSRNTNNNIEGFDINNLTTDLIALIGLIILPGLIILTNLIFVEAVKTVIKVIKILLGRKVVVIAIRFSYFL